MIKGRIIKQISNLYTVETSLGNIECSVRGKFRNKKISPVVGDCVKINENEKIIEEILPRKNYLERPVVANVDLAFIVTSVKEPNINLNLLDKLISICIINKIEPIICLTKIDLLKKDEKKDIKKLVKYYKNIGIKVITNKEKIKLKKYLSNKVAFLVGQTGSGKSTLLNMLDKSLHLEVKPISCALNRGVHTTRHVELYKIGKGFIVDTPGFSAITFKNATYNDIANSFYEFNHYKCSYNDCMHITEKDCQVKKATQKGFILESRYNNYLKFIGEVNENNGKLYK